MSTTDLLGLHDNPVITGLWQVADLERVRAVEQQVARLQVTVQHVPVDELEPRRLVRVRVGVKLRVKVRVRVRVTVRVRVRVTVRV